MKEAAANLEFEEAARMRDEIQRLEATDLGIPTGEQRFAARMRAAGSSKGRGNKYARGKRGRR